MKRPFALLGLAAFAALAVSALVGADTTAVLGELCAIFACIALCVALIFHKRLLGSHGPRVFLLCVSAALAVSSLCCVRYAAQWNSEFAEAQALDGKTVRICGVLTDTPVHQYHRYYSLLRVEHVLENDEMIELPEFTLRVSSDRPFDCEVYDTVYCTVKCSAFERDGLYSTANSRYADGVAIGGYVVPGESVYTAKELGLSPAELFVRARELISEKLSAVLPERAFGLVEAMLLGRRDSLDPTDEWNFRKVGAAHLLVISGLHMTVVAAALTLPFRLLKNVRLRSLFSSAAVLLFLCVTGFPPAAQRSGIMCVLAFVGVALGRRTDTLNSLGFAVLFICLQNPFSGGDLGFTLSVLSTLGIALCALPLTRYLSMPLSRHPVLKELLHPIASSLSTTLSALLFTLPIQASVFGGLSILSPLVNLILVLPCTAVLYLALPSALLALLPLPEVITEPLFRLLRLVSEVSLQLADDFAAFHFGYVDLTRAAGVCVIVFLVLSLVLAVQAWHRGKLRLLCAATSVAVLLSACTVTQNDKFLSIETTADSSCVVLVQGRSAAVLALGGYRTDTVRELLSKRNVSTVELLCFTEKSREVREAAAAVCESYPVETLVLAEGQRTPKELKAIENVLVPEEGETISALDGVSVTFSQSLQVLTVQYGGITAVIETADGKAGETTAPILITARKKLDTISPFTICQNDDIIETNQILRSGEEAFPEMTSSSRHAHRRCDIIESITKNKTACLGQKLLLPGDDGLSVLLYEDGHFTLRGESAWLGMNPT